MKLKRFFAAAMAAVITAGLLAGCGAGEEKQQESSTQQNSEEQEPESPTLNAYTAEYDAVVELLKEAGAIKEDAQPVDMNTTPGYWFDNMTGDLSTEAIPIGDKANDYDGVYLVWFDIDNENSEVLPLWNGMFVNSGALVYMGGACVLQMEAYTGMYALGFAADVAEETKQSALDAFGTLDSSVPADVKYMISTLDLAKLLKENGLIEATAIGSMVDLNAEYYYEAEGQVWNADTGDYDTVPDYKYYASFASIASDYAGVRIFYFDSFDEYLSMYAAGAAMAEVESDNTISAYVDTDKDWVYEKYTAKDGVYDADGETVTFTIDAELGRFAVSVDDSVDNKQDIVDFLKTLEN